MPAYCRTLSIGRLQHRSPDRFDLEDAQRARRGDDMPESAAVRGRASAARRGRQSAAQEGDQRAITILSEVGLNLGRGISMLIQLLNPELIILGGVVAEANQYILTPIQQALNVYSMAKSREKTKIALYQLGAEVGLRGAIAVVTDKLFEEVLAKPN